MSQVLVYFERTNAVVGTDELSADEFRFLSQILNFVHSIDISHKGFCAGLECRWGAHLPL